MEKEVDRTQESKYSKLRHYTKYFAVTIDDLAKTAKYSVFEEKYKELITYLAPDIQEAVCYGDVVLEVDYYPVGVDGTGRDNFGFNAPKGQFCWQFSVFTPIPIEAVRRLTKKEVKNLNGTFNIKKFNKKMI